MNQKQLVMFMNGTSEKMVAEAKAYEREEFKKAFSEGTENAWNTYRRNVNRRVNEVNRITGIGLDAGALME